MAVPDGDGRDARGAVAGWGPEPQRGGLGGVTGWPGLARGCCGVCTAEGRFAFLAVGLQMHTMPA